jgi:hypothetical protein
VARPTRERAPCDERGAAATRGSRGSSVAPRGSAPNESELCPRANVGKQSSACFAG